MPDPRTFEHPLYVKPYAGDVAIEVRNAEEAIDFLAEFPVEHEPLMDAALDACIAAVEDPSFAKFAELSFLKFAKAYGVLFFEPLSLPLIETASKHRSFQ